MFQYSHVLHVAPGKMIHNCARSSIKNLNDVISFYCLAYTKCHLAMIQLVASEHILSSFPMLSKQDVKASMALLTPNIHGSSTLHLSWIWQTDLSATKDTPSALQECACSICHLSLSYSIVSLTCTLAEGLSTERVLGGRSYPHMV